MLQFLSSIQGIMSTPWYNVVMWKCMSVLINNHLYGFAQKGNGLTGISLPILQFLKQKHVK